MPAPQPRCSADIQAHSLSAADTAPQQKGGRAKSGARGAVGGAVIGGIAGSAGTRAAVAQPQAPGAVGGSSANAAAKDQASAQAGAQVEQQYQSENAAYSQKMSTFKRAFSSMHGCARLFGQIGTEV